MADRRRCTIFNNRNPEDGKVMLLPSNTTMESFLKQLGITASKVFFENGGEVEEIQLIRDNDTLFVSQGESFNSKSKPNLTEKRAQTYQIAVMGPGAVGKSALTLQYVQGVFVIDYDPTIEDAYRKNIILDGKREGELHSYLTLLGEPVTLDILDTAGQEDYVALRTCWYRGKDGFLLVFSTVDHQSFDVLHKFYDELININDAVMPPVIIIGNKADITGRQVTHEEAQAFVDEFKQYPIWYMETSAKTGQNVDKAFSTLARRIRDRARANVPSGGEFKCCGTNCVLL